MSEKYLNKDNNFYRKLQTKAEPIPTVLEVMQAVADYYKIDIQQLKKIDHKSNKTRKIAMYLSSVLSQQKLQDIADQFGDISDNAISKATSKIKQDLNVDVNLSNEIQKIKDNIKEFSVVST